MALLRKVNASMFDQVYPLLQELDPQLPQSTWQQIFQPPWTPEENYCGYGLWDGEIMVGFLGLIFSQRQIEHKPERFCNVSSWIVKPSYRGQSMSLMLPLMKLKNYTLTDFSSYQELFPLLKRMGFKELDYGLKWLIPFCFRKERYSSAQVQILETPERIRDKLQEDDRVILDDHQAIAGCQHLWVGKKDRGCYVVYTFNQSGPFSYCYVQFISNVQFFSECSFALRLSLAKRHQTPFILVDSRLIAQVELPWIYKIPLRFTKLYKSDCLAPQQIDNLYSELVLLNFNLLPRSIFDLARELLRPEVAYE